jgi:Uma2 family endonuclease
MDMWSGTDNSKPSIYSARQKGHVSMPMTSKDPEEVTPANHIPGPKQGEWTYSHYAALPDDGNRYEIIDGVLYMAPSPDAAHQHITLWISIHLALYVEETNQSGNVFTAPLDVKLFQDTVVQPDVLVILNEHKERISKHVIGAPDLVVEVLSSRTERYDRQQKQHIYACAGVAEYWIVDPTKKDVEVLVLEGENYLSTAIFSGNQILQSKLLPDFSIQVKQFFR